MSDTPPAPATDRTPRDGADADRGATDRQERAGQEMTGQPEPSTTGQPEPSTTGQPEPSTTGEAEPSTTGEAEPSTTGEAEPGGSAKRQGRNPVPIVVAVVAVVLLALVGLLAFSGGSEEPDTASQVLWEDAPPLRGSTIDGGSFDLADERGDWVVVNFFATWCPPCVAEHPELVAFSDSNAFDAEVVSVAFDEPTPTVQEFFDTHGGDWPVVAQSDQTPLDWAVIRLPETFLVTPEGEVAKKYNGGVTAAGLEADIGDLANDRG